MVSHYTMKKIYIYDKDFERFKTIKKIIEIAHEKEFSDPQMLKIIIDDFITYNNLNLDIKVKKKKIE